MLFYKMYCFMCVTVLFMCAPYDVPGAHEVRRSVFTVFCFRNRSSKRCLRAIELTGAQSGLQLMLIAIAWFSRYSLCLHLNVKAVLSVVILML